MEKNVLPDYDQDDQFDYDIDLLAFEYIIPLIGSFIGSGLAAISLAIYYLIINF